MVKKRLFLAVDVGGTKTLMMLCREKKIISKIKFKTSDIAFLDNLKDNIHDFLHSNQTEEKKIYAAGFSLPGPFLITRSGLSMMSPNIGDGKLIQIEKEFKKIFGKIEVLNDAVCGAIGEHEAGSLKKINNSLYVTWSTGIGGGLIMNKEVLLGKNGNCGHIGHTIISDKRRKCGCGLFGDMESMSSGKSIEKIFGGKISAEEIFYMCSKNDRKAEKIIQNAVEYFSRGIFNAATFLDLEMISIGGSVFLKNEKILLPKIFDFFKKYRNPQTMSLKITKASLGEDSSLFGAFYHIFKKNA
jgi:glucokinase